MSSLIDRPALKRLAAEASMSDDPDFQKANYALQVLRQARLSRNETAAREHLLRVPNQIIWNKRNETPASF